MGRDSLVIPVQSAWVTVMAQRNGLRASDADREQVADRLRRAAAEGRLLAEELEQRLGEAFRARTYGELDATVADLPGERVARSSPFVHPLARPALALAVVLAAAAVIAAAVLVIAGMLAVWGVWALVAWWILGGRCARRHGASRDHRHWRVHSVSRQVPRAWL